LSETSIHLVMRRGSIKPIMVFLMNTDGDSFVIEIYK
jgi:hypothetical protein